MLARNRRNASMLVAVVVSSILLICFVQSASAITKPFDPAFGSSGKVGLKGFESAIDSRSQIAVARDGSFVVVGSVRQTVRMPGRRSAPAQRWLIARFTKDGKPDAKFGNKGRVVLNFPGEMANYPRQSVASGVTFDRRGRLLIAGSVDHARLSDYRRAVAQDDSKTAYGDVQNNYLGLVRLTRSGRLDRSFAGDGMAQTRLFERQGSYGPIYVRAAGIGELPGGRIVVGATGSQLRSPYDAIGVFAYHADGRRVTGFGTGGRRVVPDATALRFTPRGQIFAGGIKTTQHTVDEGELSWSITKLKANGDFDESYGLNGVSILSTGVDPDTVVGIPAVEKLNFDLAPLSSGRVVMTGVLSNGPRWFSALGVARFGVNGKLDESFGESGLARAPFGANVSSVGAGLVVGSSGEILVGGTKNMLALSQASGHQGVIAKFTSSGSFVTSWAPSLLKKCRYGPRMSSQLAGVLLSGCIDQAAQTIFRIKP